MPFYLHQLDLIDKINDVLVHQTSFVNHLDYSENYINFMICCLDINKKYIFINLPYNVTQHTKLPIFEEIIQMLYDKKTMYP